MAKKKYENILMVFININKMRKYIVSIRLGIFFSLEKFFLEHSMI